MRIDVVVARYKEDVSWLENEVFLGLNVFVYNKFYDGDLKLPNVGRESHTYLHHIIKHYDNLADVTTFLQGDPFGHSRRDDFFNHIKNVRSVGKFIPFSNHGPGVLCDLTGLPHHPGLPLKEDFEFIFKRPPLARKMAFYAGAMFSVPKQLILNHDLDTYVKLFNRLSDPNEPKETGYTMERLWPLIMGEPELIWL